MKIARDWKKEASEAEEQQALFEWAAYAQGEYPELRLMYHIPNEGKRSTIAGALLKAEGLRRGVPDICLPVARGGKHGLYIEMKRLRGGRLSKEQGDWIFELMKQGYSAHMCYGWEAARVVILSYLNE